MNLTDLVPPHSVEAEQGVLGGLLLDNSAWDLIAETVSAQDFFKREHRLIFQAIQKLAAANQGFDVVTVADAMAEVPEAGGLSYLSELAKNTPSVANISIYAAIVRERSHLRQLILLGHECSRGATAAQAKSVEVQEEFEQKLFGLAQQYKYSGASRDDFAANNARAQEARDSFGDLPQDVLEGTRRSEFAPPVVRHRAASVEEPTANDSGEDQER